MRGVDELAKKQHPDDQERAGGEEDREFEQAGCDGYKFIEHDAGPPEQLALDVSFHHLHRMDASSSSRKNKGISADRLDLIRRDLRWIVYAGWVIASRGASPSPLLKCGV